MRLNVYDIINT